jgi:hypothetical protein
VSKASSRERFRAWKLKRLLIQHIILQKEEVAARFAAQNEQKIKSAIKIEALTKVEFLIISQVVKGLKHEDKNKRGDERRTARSYKAGGRSENTDES